MKKTLIALGVLAALPSLALSAEVSIYGKVDVGLAFVNVDPGVDGQDSWSNLSMQSGQTAGSRNTACLEKIVIPRSLSI